MDGVPQSALSGQRPRTVLQPQALDALSVLIDAAKVRFPRSTLERIEHAFAIASGKTQIPGSEHPYQRPSLYFPGLPATPWHDPAVHEGVAILEEGYPRIRAELERLLSKRQGFQPYLDSFLVDGGCWNAFYLRLESSDLTLNHQLCPETTEIIESIPRIGETALFSALTPGAHIAAHCGPWNFRLTIHLGLFIPDGCSFRVADEIRHWEEGKCLIFDDSFEHEVWNCGSKTRFCLLTDVWHPDLTPVEMVVLEAASHVLSKLFREDQRVHETRNTLDGKQWWA